MHTYIESSVLHDKINFARKLLTLEKSIDPLKYEWIDKEMRRLKRFIDVWMPTRSRSSTREECYNNVSSRNFCFDSPNWRLLFETKLVVNTVINVLCNSCCFSNKFYSKVLLVNDTFWWKNSGSLVCTVVAQKVFSFAHASSPQRIPRYRCQLFR